MATQLEPSSTRSVEERLTPSALGSALADSGTSVRELRQLLADIRLALKARFLANEPVEKDRKSTRLNSSH